MIAQTSLLAYQEIKVSGQLSNQSLKVLRVLKQSLKPMNDKMISRSALLPINVVTARRNELEKQGYVLCVGVANCPETHRLTKMYKANEVDESWTM